ncbi:type III secretion system HrpP C-terminal domain-containing protein [Pseudomonas borbori]
MNPAEVKQPPREASTTRWRDSDQEPAGGMQNLLVQGDGRWFAQLLGNQGGGSQGHADGAGALSSAALLEVGTLNALVDQLAPRLHDLAEAPLQALLHLPQLGRVSVSARRVRGEGWDIDLRADDQDSQERLAACQQRCQDALGQALGQPVTLRVDEERVA